MQAQVFTQSISQQLEHTFGYTQFRPGQAESIQAVLNQQDAMVLLPTGGGKSLCYQLPALLLPGVTLVISPLIALMKDQVESLERQGVAAAAINNSIPREQMLQIFNRARHGELKMLYVAPERALHPAFIERIREIGPSLIAIDEAHCISQWGHDFRPEYARLGELKQAFPHVPMMALTATADPATRNDILQQLSLRQPYIHIGSFDRPNIRYNLIEKVKGLKQALDFCHENPGESGVIYCSSRKKVEDLAERLADKGVNCAAYHAGLSMETRNAVQDGFLKDDIQVVVATVAFGMGVHKPDIRFVLHLDVPKSIEAYYQETGRAGRDGLPAEARLLYDPADASRVRRLIELSDNPDRIQIENQRFNAMTSLAECQTCRRQILLNYFAEPSQQACGNCDICLDPPTRFDATEIAQKALSCVYRMEQRFGMQQVIDVLRGAKHQKVIEHGHDKLSTWGIGKDKTFDYWLSIMRQLIHQGLLYLDITRHSTLALTPEARPVLKGERTLELAVPRIDLRRVTTRTQGQNYDRKLFALLRNLRKKIADEEEIPPYIVFNDASLAEMASKQPTDNKAFLEINGVGYSKLSRYGESFIQAITDYLDKH